MPREENRAISSSKLIPPIPMTSIMSAGLLRVLQRRVGKGMGGEGGQREGRGSQMHVVKALSFVNKNTI